MQQIQHKEHALSPAPVVNMHLQMAHVAHHAPALTFLESKALIVFVSILAQVENTCTRTAPVQVLAQDLLSLPLADQTDSVTSPVISTNTHMLMVPA
jgi:hypothetical protein